ncbi:unnamed protein product [Didymodactylos carnosus]|uniref:RIB43A-like with coiled-coils protein 2 n=1 Tax=Didymodactylos carnosus TaxID=1234261 RepID=A0A8S2K5L8_9BILA|nr:unnamed protein product [Didymodactylos carnosus]CAF3838404.1 unnamed protein product [Didymodactylos carnosus]
MFLLNLPSNPKELAAIERRRRNEKERQARIFNVKYRTIGIDKEMLDEQVRQRELIQEMERRRDEAFAREMIRNDLKALVMEQDERQKDYECAKRVDEFRKLYQKPEMAREWDLNNPDALKNGVSPRIMDDDPRLGPASIQSFAGEDLNLKARKKLQQEQLKEYFNTQRMIRKKNERQQQLADLLFDCKQTQLNQIGYNFEKIEEECKRAIGVATRHYNETMASEAKMKEREQRKRDTDEQLSEIIDTAFSNLLTEDDSTAVSAVNPSRVVVDRWKGMTKDQLNEIRNEQLKQMEQRQKCEIEEERFNAKWDLYHNVIAKQGTIIEQKLNEETKRCNQTFADYNLKLAETQKEREKYLKNVVYRSVPSSTFYTQFNTTSR